MGENGRSTSDEREIRRMIEEWASAVRRRDRDGILRHHSRDILMFDVPPPVQSKGLDAYNGTWDLFFSASPEPVAFDILDMGVTAGREVAFVTAVMRCNERTDGELIFRLTVGLRKIDGQWTVMHEHHSLPAR